MYRAIHPDDERLVAIKVFRLDVPPERVHQFVAELEKLIAANLAHPGIAAPIAAGIASVSAYLVQEFAEADSLDVVVRDYGPAPPPDAVRIVTELAGALDFAAVVNVTHGMLHPRDVLIAAEDVRLTGLGIGQALERIGVAVPVRRPYTAPERLPGRRWDRRADVFSLAAVMFELLFGRRISGTGDQAREAVTEIAGANVRQLRAVFARALAEDPSERFETALEFAEQLKGAFSEAALTFVPRTEPAAAAADAAPNDPAPPSLEGSAAAAEPLVAASATDVHDLDLRVAEAARYDQVESAPSVIPGGVAAEITAAEAAFSGPGDPPSPSPSLPAASSGGPSPAQRSSAVASSPASPVGSGFSRIDSSSSPGSTAYAIPSPPAPPRRSLLAPISLALLLGAIIGVLLSGAFFGSRTRSVPAIVQMTGAPPPVAASAAPRAETVPTEPPIAPAPSSASPQTSGPDEAAVAPRPVGGNRPENNGSASSAGTAAARPSPADAGRLLVRSTPAGAHVLVDGKDAGPTPVTVHDLPSGTHVVRIARDGYTTEERRIAITAARPAQSLEVELTRPRASMDRAAAPAPSTPGTVGRFVGVLVIDSRPSGANVFVDGKLAGRTPVEVSSVDAGSHALRLELDGYQRWTSAVRVVAGERNRVTASLER